MKRVRLGSIGEQLGLIRRNPKTLGATALGIADLFSRTIGLAITPYLANKMGPSGFGALNLYLAAVEILAFLLVLGGPALVAADYVRNGYHSARQVRADTLRIALYLAVALLGVSLVVSWRFPSEVPITVGFLVVAVSYVTALNSLELYYYRGAQIYKYAVFGQFAYSLLSLGLTVLIFEFASATAASRLLAIALAGGIVQLAYLIELRHRHYDKASSRQRRANKLEIIRFGLSLSVYVASQWILASIDRFAIAGYAGLAAAGVYSVGATVASVPAVFFLVVSQQLQPFLYHRLRDHDYSGFRRVQLIFVASVVITTPVYLFICIALFDVFFAEEYSDAKGLLPVLLIGTSFKAIFFIFTHACFYQQRGAMISSVAASALGVHLVGLAYLVVTGNVTMHTVAVVFCVSSAFAALGMAVLSQRTVAAHQSERTQTRQSEEDKRS